MIDSASRPLSKTYPQKPKGARLPVPATAADARLSASASVAPATPAVVAGYRMEFAPKLINIERVCEMLGLKRSAVHAKAATGELPSPIKFGTSRRAAARWLEHEIVGYVLAKAAARTPLAPMDTPSGK